MERHPGSLARINLKKKKLCICNRLCFNFHLQRLPFVTCVLVATRLLILWKKISEAISTFILKNAEEYSDHLGVLESAERQGLTSAAGSMQGSCWNDLSSDRDYL